MSQTSIHFKDQGYTSPDFLTNLFKKPLYSSYSSINSINTLEVDSPLLKNSQNRLNIQSKENEPYRYISQRITSPLAFKGSKQSKYFRSDQGINEEKISSKKYKIFFKTLLYGKMTQQQMNSMWQKLEKSLVNPFDFDNLIQQIRCKRQKEIQSQILNKLQQKKKKKVNSKSLNHNVIRRDLLKSLRKKKDTSDMKNAQLNGSMRNTIKKSVIEMRNILAIGQKFYRRR